MINVSNDDDDDDDDDDGDSEGKKYRDWNQSSSMYAVQ